MKLFIFDSMKFKFKYDNFNELLEDIEHIKVHYASFGLETQYEVMPACLEVHYEITKPRQAPQGIN
jgi:hypothetical protein